MTIVVTASKVAWAAVAVNAMIRTLDGMILRSSPMAAKAL